jgi:glycosyltransferase involved in cell wall biosynthesis
VRILVDCRYTRLEHHDGISRYGARLTAALAPLAAARGHDLTMLISNKAQLTMLPDLPWALASSVTSPREPWVARQINPLGVDVVFTPMQTMGGSGRRYGLVKTLHDLIYYRNRTPPRDLNPAIRLLWRAYHLAWWPQRVLLNQADEVVTISETTRALMVEHHLTKRRISIVPNAADPAPASGPRSQPTTRDLLYMGSFMPYKNVETLIEAVKLLPGYRLHLLSRGAPAAYASDQVVLHDGVTDDEYLELLEGAFALVHASLEEGFGIPLIEAMSVGTPVVLSDIPIFREVGEDAAAYFPPKDAEAAAMAIRGLEDPALWAARSAAGRLVAAKYSWDASAAVLLEVLERVRYSSVE